MITVWGRRNSSNVIPVMWALSELNVEHTRHNVGGSFGGNNTENYLAMNPNGLVPTIEDGDLVLWESNAIVRYLSRRYGMGTLFPEDPNQAAIADQWMEWCKSVLTPAMMPVFWGLIRLPKDSRDHDEIQTHARLTGDKLKILNRQLSDRMYVAGDHLTMGDLPLGASIYRYYNLDIERPSLPNVEAWYDRLCKTPSYQKHAMIPFGTSLEEWNQLEREDA